MDTPEEAKKKIRDMVDADKAKAEKDRPRTYTERLQDMGRLPKPSGGGGGSGGAAEIKSLQNPRAMKKGGTASSRADGCCVKGKTKGKML
jgi:hypothetical protein